MKATAFAHPNIAFIKYWGNLDENLHLPANGSISMCLDGLTTRTSVIFDPNLAQDHLTLDGQSIQGEALIRVSSFLDHVRHLAGANIYAQVASENNFPSGAGIASSASAFAALALAASFIGLYLAVAAERYLLTWVGQNVLANLRALLQPDLLVRWLPGLAFALVTLLALRRWSHFLINSQILKISYLEAHEALRLIEQPVRDFGLKHTAQTAWHILGLTSGHPYLLQALCFELVMLKNEQPEDIRHTASYHDIEEAAKRVFTSNRFFFADITNAQITPAARYMLSYLAGMGKGRMITADEWQQLFPENFQSNLNVILRRDLVTPDGPGYRFQVELIRRWFDQQMV